MSYLDAVRLHFAGQFQADPSTVNNITDYYNNATFKKEYQQPGPQFGLWNPEGGAAWRLVECRVTRVCYADGTSTTDPNADRVVGMRIADTNQRVAGKLVDLDPDQQMVSEIWGLIVRLTDGATDFFSGAFETAAFSNLWRRAANAGRPAQQPLSAMYQSILAPVTWGDAGDSRFLRELRDALSEDVLSIKFNVDGYDRDRTIPTFTLGRITGTIGPARADEPHHFVLGRQLGGTDPRVYFMPCVVDAAKSRIVADFGNSIQTVKPGTELNDIGALSLGWVDQTHGYTSIADVPYRDSGWYDSTAGVQSFPLSDEQLSAIATSPIAVAINGSVVLQENVDGLYVRADTFVYRLSPETPAEVQLYATQYGALQDGAQISVAFDPANVQPPTGLTFDPPTPIVAGNGRATLILTGHDPQNPRGFVDGQVYGVRPVPQAVTTNPPGSWINRWDSIAVLVWDAFDDPEPTWHGSMQEIFTQYGNLYPLMDKLIDLTDYDAVAAHAPILSFVFSLPVSDPNSMPVTRDLSPAKRAAILKWLNTPGPDGKPLQGTPAPETKAFEESAPAPQAPRSRDELFLMKSGLDEREES